MSVVVAGHWRETTDSAPRPEPDTLPLHRTLTDTTLSAYAASELGRLDDTVTPAAWAAGFPRDTIEPLRPALDWVFARDPLAAEWCLRAQRRTYLRPDGPFVVREAFFYPPDPRRAEPLPDVHHGHEYAARHCRLGALSVTARVEEMAQADSLARTLRKSFSELLGQGTYDDDYGVLGARGWASNARWNRSDTTWFVYHEQTRPATFEVRATARLPSSGIRLERYSGWRAHARRNAGRLRHLGEMVGLDGSQLDRLLALYRAGAGWTWGERAAWSDSLLLATLSEWLPRSDTMSAPRRAAALLVADRVLSAGSSAGIAHRWDDGRWLRDTLDALGAEWERRVGTPDLYYAGNLLREAYRLDGDGVAGRRAFLHLLERGFGAPCNSGSEGPSRVIREGTRFLTEFDSDAAPRWIRREVHQRVAEAYGDVLVLQTAPPSNLIPRRSGDPVVGPAEARERAVRHYRKALEMGPEDEDGYTALWRAGWRMAAGLLPLQTNFVCVSD